MVCVRLFALLVLCLNAASSFKLGSTQLQGRRAVLSSMAAAAVVASSMPGAAQAKLRPGCNDPKVCSGPSPPTAFQIQGPKTKDQKGFGVAAGCNIEKPCKKEVGGFPWGATLGAKCPKGVKC